MLSLVLTYRNRDLKIVKRCLGSLKIQSDQDFKVFLVNYGSSDKFTAEIEGLVKLYDFIDYIFVPTYGQLWNKSRAINIALKKCKTSYFLMGDIDLIYHPEMIEKCKQLVKNYEVVYFQYAFLDQKESLKDYDFFGFEASFLGNEEITGTTLYKTETLKKINGYDEFYHGWGAEDTDVHLRLKNAGHSVYFYDQEILVKHQWHPKQYRSKESEYPFHTNLEKINHRYMVLQNQHKITQANPEFEWGKMPDIDWPKFDFGDVIATRKVWGSVIEAMAPKIKTLVGGSADLEPSNVTAGFAAMVKDFDKGNHQGRNFAYGVREFPMGAINNGIAQHGGLKIFGATFFVFSDYERPAIRMRALQKLPVISEYTHDSIFVGEDGPTHQPIEHLMASRTIPNLLVLRPCDANEAVVASRVAFEQSEFPSLVLLTRQGLPVLDRSKYPSEEEFRKGAYIISDYEQGEPDISIFASGSEVSLALDVKDALKSQFNIRVVNFGCWELFDIQSADYKNNIIHDESFKVSIEAGITQGWEKYTGNYNALNIGINRFGESAPGKDVANFFGLNAETIKEKIIKAFNR